MKKILVMWLVLAAAMDSSLASTHHCINPTLYTDIINASCDVEATFGFYPESVAKIGHFVNLSFSSNDRKLANDIHVRNPENPNSMVDIAGVISDLSWGCDDVLWMSFNLSPQNKAILHEALCTSPEGLELAVELVIYDYDYQEKKHFPCFYMKNPVKFEISGRVKISDKPESYLKSPVVFSCSMSLKASKNVFNQKIYFSTSASGKTHKRNLND